MENHEIVEKMIRGMIAELELTPNELFIGIHNAVCHGEAFKKILHEDIDLNWGEDDENLKGIFMGIDIACEFAEKTES